MRTKATSSSASAQSPGCFDRLLRTRRSFTVAQDAPTGDPAPTTTGNPGNVGLNIKRLLAPPLGGARISTRMRRQGIASGICAPLDPGAGRQWKAEA
jgi:hypothetical protein